MTCRKDDPFPLTPALSPQQRCAGTRPHNAEATVAFVNVSNAETRAGWAQAGSAFPLQGESARVRAVSPP